MPESILITSSTGAIGTRLLPLLLSSLPPTTPLICPTSSPSRLAALASQHPNVIVAEGQISDPSFLETLCRTHKVTKIFLNIGGVDETFTTLNALDAFARGGTVRHIVHVSAHGDFTSVEGEKDVFNRHLAANYLSKLMIEKALLHGDFPFTWTVLGPAAFFDNDVRFGDVRETGFLTLPYGSSGVSRVSCEDIALAGVRALENKDGWLNGRKIPLGGWKTYTAVETAALWSETLGEEVEFRKDDEEALRRFEGDLNAILGKLWARALVLMYRAFLRDGWVLSEDDYAFQKEVLGKEADDYGEWVVKVVKEKSGA